MTGVIRVLTLLAFIVGHHQYDAGHISCRVKNNTMCFRNFLMGWLIEVDIKKLVDDRRDESVLFEVMT